ncbi:hypothetical protein O181_125350 [Austropuccinia psidii MF-1]|uniref:Uncharacterized protein n=1 Tax=Austropuccinia psidii MF-1 TaxID=1389203 RepID=A0A9Q3Q611_9BASI|nr:hypothetical protein [Austropuccinia psidii MF-1]
MSPVDLRNLGFQRKQPEDGEGLSRTGSPGGGHLGHSGVWQDIEGNSTHSAIHFPIQQKSQARGLEEMDQVIQLGQLLKDLFSMEHEEQEVQPSILLGRTWSKLPEDMSQRDRP